ncbi:MAG TPA: hypothetical protein VNN77_00870 [candidate division Zixibacteria bacterium]|nr:hypothetical protein [candidate division Zixibacteria bacterium]
MRWELGEIFRVREYKGRAMRAASYQIKASEWVPEAWVSHRTERGWRRLWVQSFSHLLGPPPRTFATQEEADACAFLMAQALIDRIQADPGSAPCETGRPLSRYLCRLLGGRRRGVKPR